MGIREIFLLITLIFTFNAIATEREQEEFDNIKNLLTLSLEELVNLEFVSIATGVEQSALKAPAMANVITAEDIKAMGARDLDEVLETVAGIHVTKNQIYNSIYMIRGIYTDTNPHVLVLINGVPTNTFLDGNRGRVWGGMPLNAVQRIEVMRGAASAVFGADALAGVINIITKRAKDIKGTEVGARLGSFNRQDIWLLHGTRWKDVDVAFSVEYGRTDGHKAIIEADKQTTYDKQFGTDISHAPNSVNLSQRNLDIRLDFKYQCWQWRVGYQGRRDVGAGIGWAEALAPNTTYLDDRFNTDLTYHRHFTDWDITTQLAYYRSSPFESTHKMELYPAGAFGNKYPAGYFSQPDFSEQHLRFDTSSIFTGFDKHKIRIGIGYHFADAYNMKQTANFGPDPFTGKAIPINTIIHYQGTEPYAALPEHTRKSWHVFAQDMWQFAENWELTTGVRYDHYDDFGSTINPRLALVWQTSEKLITKLLYGEAFRAPALNELHNIHSPMGYGNPNLKPEDMRSAELAFIYQATPQLQLSSSLYRYEIKNLIRYKFDKRENVNFSAKNSGQLRGHGIEVEAKWKANEHFNLTANYAFQHVKDQEKGHLIPFVPQNLVYLRTNWQFSPNWYLNTQLNVVMNRRRGIRDERPPIDDYLMADMTLRRTHLLQNIDMTLGVRNLFNDDAREPSRSPDFKGILALPNDLPLAERNYFVEFRYTFE